VAPAYETILLAVDGPVATVTLNRPEQLNAYSGRMGLELGHALEACDADDAIRAIIVTGAGRAFCAGADLSGGGFGRGRPAGWAELEAAYGAPHRPGYELSTPIIAAINGACVGFGLTLAMEWDIRIASADARLGFIFNRRGIMPDGDICWSLPRLIGASRAFELILTGRLFTGAEAQELGVVSRAVPAAEVLPAALEAARDIAVNVAPVSTAASKRLLWAMLGENDRTVARGIQDNLVAWAGQQPDAREGVEAFLAHRTPQWQLRKVSDLPEQILDGEVSPEARR
jgi:enoyl-CoA hydratase/carnithine racemase